MTTDDNTSRRKFIAGGAAAAGAALTVVQFSDCAMPQIDKKTQAPESLRQDMLTHFALCELCDSCGSAEGHLKIINAPKEGKPHAYQCVKDWYDTASGARAWMYREVDACHAAEGRATGLLAPINNDLWLVLPGRSHGHDGSPAENAVAIEMLEGSRSRQAAAMKIFFEKEFRPYVQDAQNLVGTDCVLEQPAFTVKEFCHSMGTGSGLRMHEYIRRLQEGKEPTPIASSELISFEPFAAGLEASGMMHDRLARMHFHSHTGREQAANKIFEDLTKGVTAVYVEPPTAVRQLPAGDSIVNNKVVADTVFVLPMEGILKACDPSSQGKKMGALTGTSIGAGSTAAYSFLRKQHNRRDVFRLSTYATAAATCTAALGTLTGGKWYEAFHDEPHGVRFSAGLLRESEGNLLKHLPRHGNPQVATVEQLMEPKKYSLPINQMPVRGIAELAAR